MSGTKEYPILALGATMTSLGLATARPREVVVLESGGCPAPEFAAAFYPGKGYSGANITPQTAALEKELSERAILADGRYHIGALAPVLFRHIRDAGLNCLFWSDLIGIESRDDGSGYAVDFFNASGMQRLTAAKIVDTTIGNRTSHKTGAKRLWSVLHGCAGTDAATPVAAASLEWRPGRFDNESYCAVRLAPETDWPQARRQLLKAWNNRPAALAETRIAAIATEFQYDVPRTTETVAPGWIHSPSVSYNDPLAAFDAGIGMATEEW